MSYPCIYLPDIFNKSGKINMTWKITCKLYRKCSAFLDYTANSFGRSDSSPDGPSLWNGILWQAAEPEAAEETQLQHPAGCDRTSSGQQQRLVQPPLLRSDHVLNNFACCSEMICIVIGVWGRSPCLFFNLMNMYRAHDWIVKTIPVLHYFLEQIKDQT